MGDAYGKGIVRGSLKLYAFKKDETILANFMVLAAQRCNSDLQLPYRLPPFQRQSTRGA